MSQTEERPKLFLSRRDADHAIAAGWVRAEDVITDLPVPSKASMKGLFVWPVNENGEPAGPVTHLPLISTAVEEQA